MNDASVGAQRAAISCLLAVAVYGCRDDRRHQASEITELEVRTSVVAPNAAPADVTRALLTRLAKAQNARDRGLGDAANRDEYYATMAEVRGLAARKAIFDRYRALGGPQVPIDLTEEGAVRTVTDSWVSICAHYADRLDSAMVSPAGVNKGNATVVADVPLAQSDRGADMPSHPEVGTRIVVHLVTDSPNAWGVERIELEASSTSVVGPATTQLPITPSPAAPASRPTG